MGWLPMLPMFFVRATGARGWGERIGDPLLLNSVLMLPASYVVLIAHQCVRATAGHFLGIRSGVSIGAGRRLASFEVGSARVTLKWYPSGATVVAGTIEPRSLRLRTWLMCFSGILSMVVVGGAAWYVGGGSLDALAANVLKGPAMTALALLAAVFTLVATDDAYQLVTIPFRPASRLSSMLMWGHLYQGLDRGRRGDHVGVAEASGRALEYAPDDPVARLMNLEARQNLGDPALDLAKAFLDNPSLLPMLRIAALNYWAWGCYLSKDPQLLAAADEASSKALFLAKNDPVFRANEASFLDTRGHVLAWAERHDEATDTLTRANTMATTPGTRCSSACGLAMVNAACGRIPEAEGWLTKAREQMPTSHLIADAEKQLAAARATDPA